MTHNLIKYVNKTVLVSIPALSGDVKCRPYTLTGVELIGLWLESADLANGFLSHDYKTQAQTWAFFVPYSQIACVIVRGNPASVRAAGSTSPGAGNVPAPSEGSSPASGASSADCARRAQDRDRHVRTRSRLWARQR